jgi:SpoIID/LytB domain protein
MLVALALAVAALQELPPPLPPPLPGPGEGDALELLWGHRLALDATGAPVVAVRIAAGRDELPLRTRGATRLEPRGGAPVSLPGGARLVARVAGGWPASLAHHVVLAELAPGDGAGLAAARDTWAARGHDPVERTVGGVHAVAGRTVDTRRTLLLSRAESAAAAGALAARLRAEHGVRAPLHAEVERRPSGTVEVQDDRGRTLARGDRLVSLAGAAGFDLGGRRYRGVLHLTVDAAGRLAAVEALALEPLLRGIVPSEIPASAPAQALRAQAVTARSNVLAQLGTRHLADPWSLCDEVHCQAYRGADAGAAATDAAVRDTAGEVLLDGAGAVVDGVYSAACGGHGEDADAVWDRPASSSLRGRPDLAAGEARWARALADEATLRAFLRDPPPAWCAAAPAGRFRWERRIASGELARLTAPLGVGAPRALRVLRRGVSGRALALEVEGAAGRATVEGELAIRRLLGDLHSAMLVVEPAPGGVVLRGGGWGHGAGMCQWGAIGRARAGAGYREILGAYFAGARVAKIY